MKRPATHALVIAAGLCLLTAAKVGAQDVLGTSFGIPNSSPGVFWPRGSSLETLGFGRLYPNGPEFGLGNTSGGFGVTGSGRLSGVGLAERSVPTFVQEQMARPYANTQRLTSAFNTESARSANIFSSVLGGQFRSQTRIGSLGQSTDLAGSGSLILPAPLPSVDSVLRDRPATSDAVLKTDL
jgi:hypothetical protein